MDYTTRSGITIQAEPQVNRKRLKKDAEALRKNSKEEQGKKQ